MVDLILFYKRRPEDWQRNRKGFLGIVFGILHEDNDSIRPIARRGREVSDSTKKASAVRLDLGMEHCVGYDT